MRANNSLQVQRMMCRRLTGGRLLRQLTPHLVPAWEALCVSAVGCAGDEGSEPTGVQVGAGQGSGAFQREEQKQSAVPMEAAEAHFHLMPSRPSLEVNEEDEVCIAVCF